ncbi:MAG: DNA-binding protein [Hespellia sp.]|nr:DNA-binding protein [Hespellia sp.]
MKNENTEPGMERVKTKEAAQELNMDLETLQYLMRKERLPIGQAVRKENAKRCTYYIYRGLLDQYKKQITG